MQCQVRNRKMRRYRLPNTAFKMIGKNTGCGNLKYDNVRAARPHDAATLAVAKMTK
jgi:hypothetical protein